MGWGWEEGKDDVKSITYSPLHPIPHPTPPSSSILSPTNMSWDRKAFEMQIFHSCVLIEDSVKCRLHTHKKKQLLDPRMINQHENEVSFSLLAIFFSGKGKKKETSSLGIMSALVNRLIITIITHSFSNEKGAQLRDTLQNMP